MRTSVIKGRGAAIIRQLPHFYQSGDYENLLHGFVEMFGRVLDVAEEDLLRVMRAHWVKTADNEGPDQPDSTKKGDLDKIFALFMESLGGTNSVRQLNRPAGDAGIQDDAVYRERILGLIQVLLGGPSTKAGIRAVVAANLGIFGDVLEQPAIRDKIQIIEYLPKTVGVPANVNDELALFGHLRPAGNKTHIVVQNNNPVAVEMRLVLRLSDPAGALPAGFGIRNLRVIEAGSDIEWAAFSGPVVRDDVLTFLPDGSIQRNTQLVVPAGPRRRLLSENATTLYYVTADFFDASGLHPIGRFLTTLLDFHGFDNAVFDVPDPIFEYDYALTELTPATFRVLINWDIPGYTEPFDKPGDNTRSLIRFIVDRVKAAGVFAEINFIKELRDTHEHEDRLYGANLNFIPENHHLEDTNPRLESRITTYPAGIEHQHEERLFATSGVFDFTYFESMNGFA